MSSAEPPGESSARFRCCPAPAVAAVGNMGHTRAFQHGSSRFVLVEGASWCRKLFGSPASVTPERLLPERENGLKRLLQTAMLNDILAVCVAAAVVVVIATIPGAVETVRKAVATICN